MYRIRASRYPDGSPYLQVDLPPLSEPQLYILDSVVHAIWSVLAPGAGPSLVWLPARSSTAIEPGSSTQQKSPRAATPGLENPTHLSTLKGETR